MAHLSMCNSPNGSRPQLKSAALFNTHDTVATGCAPAPLTLTAPQNELLWNDGSKTTFDATASTGPTTGEIALKAYLTAGPMAGARASAAPAIVSQTGMCLLGGVRSFTLGFGVFVVTHTQAANRNRRQRSSHGRSR